jgi:hypothetical protein
MRRHAPFGGISKRKPDGGRINKIFSQLIRARSAIAHEGRVNIGPVGLEYNQHTKIKKRRLWRPPAFKKEIIHGKRFHFSFAQRAVRCQL